MGLNLPDLYGSWSQARQNGQQRVLGQQVSETMPGALQGDQNALQRLLKLDARQGMAVQQHVSGQQKAQQEMAAAKRAEGAQIAAAFLQNPSPEAARMIVPHLRSLDPQFAQIPDDAWDDPNGREPFMRAAQILATVGGSEQGPEGIAIGDTLVDRRSGKVMYQGQPRESWDLVTVPDGQGGSIQMERNKATGEWRQPTYGAAPSMPAPTTGGGPGVMQDAYRNATGTVDPVKDFPQLVASVGVPPNSIHRTPQRNADVGGTANSYHLRGQAIDLTPRTPQQKQQIRDWARQNGYDFIDEGDHVHLEPRRGVRAVSGFGPGQGIARGQLGRTPPKAQKQAGQTRQLSPDEVQARGFQQGTVVYEKADGTPIVAQRPPTKPNNTAAAQVRTQAAQLDNIERLVATLEKANDVSGMSAAFSPSWTPWGAGKESYQRLTTQLAAQLKPLIRGPGEGTWTDKDQELLERLVPQVGNHESTNMVVINELKALIKSKRDAMGIGRRAPSAPAPRPPATPKPANGGFRILD